MPFPLSSAPLHRLALSPRLSPRVSPRLSPRLSPGARRSATPQFAHFAAIHNGPIASSPAIDDDTILQTTLENSFIQSVPNRYVMGVEGAGNFRGECAPTGFQSLPAPPIPLAGGEDSSLPDAHRARLSLWPLPTANVMEGFMGYTPYAISNRPTLREVRMRVRVRVVR